MSTKECPGLASIIVPCFNQREFTRSCLQTLFSYTRASWELVVVDNGSTDDIRAYLAGVQDATAVPVTVVANATNLGFPAAINQGLQACARRIPKRVGKLNLTTVAQPDVLTQVIARHALASIDFGSIS